MPQEHYSNFTSLLEVFTAFNFAFIVSDAFNKELRGRVVGSFDVIKADLEKHKRSIDSAQTSLHEIAAQKTGTGKTVIETARTKLQKIEKEFNALNEDVINSVDNHTLISGFSELCLFTGIYTIFVMFFVGINASCSVTIVLFDEVFFIFNAMAFIFVAINLLQRKVKLLARLVGTRYRASLIAICVILVSTGILFFVILFDNKHCHSYYLIVLNILLMLLVPVLHFLFYFVLALYNSLQVSKNLENKIQKEFVDVFTEFNKNQLDPIIKYDRLETSAISSSVKSNVMN